MTMLGTTATQNPAPPGTTVDGWLAIGAKRVDGGWQYPERNAQGERIGIITRWDDPGPRPRYTANLGSRRGLIMPADGLPAYAGTSASDPVLVAEGASDAVCLLSLGHSVVGVPMAGQCADELAALMRDRHVVIISDNDDAGRRSVAAIGAALHAACTSVRISYPPTQHKDIRAWIADGGACGEDLARLIDDAQQFTPAADAVPDADTSGPVLRCLADIEPREVQWLWPGRVPLGRITLLVGRPGEGKSFLTTDMASRVSIGRMWPDGSACPDGSVILVSAEDDPADTIRPRLDAHGADVRRLHLLTTVRKCGEGGRLVEAMFTLEDLPALEAALMRHDDCRLLIIDPIGSFLGGRTDAHRDNEVRGILAPVAQLVERYGPAVLIVAHRRKSVGAIADDLAIGSRAFTGIARAVWHLTRDPNDKNRRLLLSGKNNLAPEGTGLAFDIGGIPAAISWESSPVTMCADDALAAESEGGGDGVIVARLRKRWSFSARNSPTAAKPVQK
ncbi:MAG TPA: AAA family ATPase [Phycisphaerales bacterium]|nr:AAA family ATPase [Phycisphaerales bacterium]